jgi:short-subunit dehydrogenase
MPDRPIALVTGASSGIGFAFAQLLALKRYDLVVVARRKPRLEELARAISQERGVEVEVLVADLASVEGMAAAEGRASRGDLSLLVNNAGVARYRPFAQLEPSAIEELVRLHVLATTRLARAALPGMLARGQGAIVNVASLLALSGTVPPMPYPHRAVYAGAKAYLLAFSQTLSHEVAGQGVRVQALLPGIVETEFHDDMGPAKAHIPPGMNAADVVRASLAALDRGEVVCIPPLEDRGVFDKVGEAQRAALASARTRVLASRYRDPQAL